ncbi:MAG: 4Fe-4S binding protein [Clostridia bacterium]|nr:4Fe-4S binding protein [Clostridia bacterium]
MIQLIDTALCKGCGSCVEVCPMDILRIDTISGLAKIAFLQECQTCYQCMVVCPTDAVSVCPRRKKIPMPFNYKMEDDENG